MEKRQSIPKHIAEEALKEYSEIEKLFNENQGKSIAELAKIFGNKFYLSVVYYDTAFFKVVLNRVVATIVDYNGKPALLSHFDIDISDNENEIEWQCDYTVKELKDIIKGK